MSQVITPENVNRKTWTKETVHNFDIRFTETQVLMLKSVLETYLLEYNNYPGTLIRGDHYWKQMEKLSAYIDKIIRVRYSTP